MLYELFFRDINTFTDAMNTANILLVKNTTFRCVFFPCTSSALWAFNKCPKYRGYRSHVLKSRGSYGNSTFFLKRSQYISLDFYELRKTHKAAALNKERLKSTRLRYL